MKKKLQGLLLAILLSLAINAQVPGTVHKISLANVDASPYAGTLWSPKIVADYPFLRNIPNIESDLHAINMFKLNQYIGKDSIENQIYFYVGINEKKKEKYVVVDANNNHDFSDDKMYTFSLPEKPLTKPEKAERAVGIQVIIDAEKNIVANIGIDPFNYYDFGYKSPQDKRLEVITVFSEYMEAQALINGMSVDINAAGSPNLYKREMDKETDFTLFYEDKAHKQGHKRFKLGDTIHVNDVILHFSKIEHPTIYFTEINILTDSSSIGSFAPDVYVRDLKTHNKIPITNLIKDKYVFIDFWGSWCGPCISSIPKLAEFYNKIKGRKDVLLLGVAKESKSDLGKLDKVMKNNGVTWPNFWVDNKDVTSIISKLNIQAYPTYLIIDKDGMIVYKERSMFKTEEAINFFLNLIDK